jgi:hypothetical protein
LPESDEDVGERHVIQEQRVLDRHAMREVARSYVWRHFPVPSNRVAPHLEGVPSPTFN